MEKIKNTKNINTIMLIAAIVIIAALTIAIITTLSFNNPQIMAPKAPNTTTTQHILTITNQLKI